MRKFKQANLAIDSATKDDLKSLFRLEAANMRQSVIFESGSVEGGNQQGFIDHQHSAEYFLKYATVIRNAKQVIGYVACRDCDADYLKPYGVVPEEQVKLLSEIIVDHDFRKQHMAHRMLKYLSAKYPNTTWFSEVHVDNQASNKFHQHQGFVAAPKVVEKKWRLYYVAL